MIFLICNLNAMKLQNLSLVVVKYENTSVKCHFELQNAFSRLFIILGSRRSISLSSLAPHNMGHAFLRRSNFEHEMDFVSRSLRLVPWHSWSCRGIVKSEWRWRTLCNKPNHQTSKLQFYARSVHRWVRADFFMIIIYDDFYNDLQSPKYSAFVSFKQIDRSSLIG